jgi:hypothetical protein
MRTTGRSITTADNGLLEVGFQEREHAHVFAVISAPRDNVFVADGHLGHPDISWSILDLIGASGYSFYHSGIILEVRYLVLA